MKKTITIGYDARMFGDQFTGIGRYNYEVTKRLFERKEVRFESLEMRENREQSVDNRDCKAPKSAGGVPGDSKNGKQKIEKTLTNSRQLTADSHKLNWIIFLNEPEFSAYEFPDHVTRVCVDAKHYSLAEQTKFTKKLYQAKCDLVHFSHFNLPLLYRKPFTVTIHDTTLSFFPGKNTTPLQKLAYQAVIRNAVFSAKKIITVSHNTAKDVQTLFGVPADKIQPIWNGLTDDFRLVTEAQNNAIRQKYNLGKRYLFYCGVWREHKNLKRLLLSFLQLSLRFPDLELVMTGTPDEGLLSSFWAENKFPFDGFDGLKAVSRQQHSIEQRIKPLGKVPFDDLVLLMGGAEAFVFPSLYEGFGLPILEAMKAGVPVVSSKTSSLPEVGGGAAMYFDPYSVDDMVQKISTVLHFSDSERKKIIDSGFVQAEKFSWDWCADQMWDVFSSQIAH